MYSKGLDHVVSELEGLNKSVSKLVNYEGLYDCSEAKLKPVNAKNLMYNYLHYNYKLYLLSVKFIIEDTCEEEIVNVNLELFNLALDNIIDNALKYSASNDVVRVTTKVEDGVVVFSVCNPLTVVIKPYANQLGIPLCRANPSDGRGLDWVL